MTFETIEFSKSGPVAVITLNRPDKLNAINKLMLDELLAVLEAIDADQALYATVLRGNGRAFCAGFDLQAGVAAKRSGEQQWRQALQYDLDVIRAFWDARKPVIAAVHGYALAAGFELALACDITVCDPDSLFGEPEVRFGSSIVALLLPWYTNPKRTKQILLTGEDRMDSTQALQLGIVNEVSEPGEAFNRAMEIARAIAIMDPDSVRKTKRAINQCYEAMGLNGGLKQALEISIEIESSETDVRKQFNQILREQGLQAAVRWRENRIAGGDK